MKRAKESTVLCVYGQKVAGRIVALLLCFLLLPVFFVAQVYAEDGSSAAQADAPEYYVPPFEIGGVSAYVVNLETGFVVYEKDADTPLSAASMVKLMTAIVVRERVQDLDAETVTAETWVFNELFDKNASHADIRNGETLTIRELLYALLLPSGNEAALMLAGYASGGYVNNFVFMMNQKAKELGCKGTEFVDPTGLSHQGLTTARDISLIMQEFMKDEVLVEISGSSEYLMAAHNHAAPYTIYNTNRLLVASDPYTQAYPSVSGTVKAGKTGSLGEWQNFVSVASKSGLSYCTAVMNAPLQQDSMATDPTFARPALRDSAALYSWAFGNFVMGSGLNPATPVYEIQVKYSTQKASVHLLPSNDIKVMLPVGVSGDLIEKQYSVPKYLEAPIKKGDVVGGVTLLVQGRVVGTAQLVAAQDVERNTVLFLLEKLKDLMSTTFARVFLALLAISLVLYVSLSIYFQQERIKKKTARNAKKKQGERDQDDD